MRSADEQKVALIAKLEGITLEEAARRLEAVREKVTTTSSSGGTGTGH